MKTQKEILAELRLIRKELQDIRGILEPSKINVSVADSNGDDLVKKYCEIIHTSNTVARS